ncbi:MAG: NAD(P)-dependent oxidoreductase, partial [Caulobacteraceae bacterium]
MIPVSGFEGKTVAVFGLGRTGLTAARALAAGGANVALWDEGEAGRAAAQAEGLPLVDLAAADWSQ